MKLFKVVLYLLALVSLFVFAQDNDNVKTEGKVQHETMQDKGMSEDTSGNSEANEATEGDDGSTGDTELTDAPEENSETNEVTEESSETTVEVESEETTEAEDDVESTDAPETSPDKNSESEEATAPEDGAESTDDEVHDMGAMEHSMDGMEMQHTPVEASQEMNVKLNVYKDIFSGYSIQLIVNGLIFTPENAGKQHIDGEGHAHIYIDGEKIARVYGTSFHLGNILSEGEHEIKISLNSNDHNPYTYNGELVEDTITVEVGLHGTINADEEMSVELDAYEDSLGGYNIHIQPTGFAFSAANPGALHVNGKGYAQIFVNGTVIARSYTPWYNLSGNLFREGENEIRVKLLSNNHNYYTYRTRSVSATLLVNIADTEEDPMSMEGHDLESMDNEVDESAEPMDEMDMEGHDMESMDGSKEESEEDTESDKAIEVESETEVEKASPEKDAASPEQDSEVNDSSDDGSEEDIDQKNEP